MILRGCKGVAHASRHSYSSAPLWHTCRPATQPHRCASAADDARPSTSAPSVDAAPSHGQRIYSMPELYEQAFSYRDIPAEVRFLQAVHMVHGPTGGLHSVLDLGCGPGAHVLELAAAGVPHVVGLELNPTMLQHAQFKATQGAAGAGGKRRGQVHLVAGDMRKLTQVPLPQPPQPPAKAQGFGKDTGARHTGQFDMVVCLLGTFTHLLTNRDAKAAFQGVGKLLRPGGLFVLELTHPGDLFDGELYNGTKELWEVPDGEGKLLVEWGSETDNFDPASQILDRTVVFNLMDAAEQVAQSYEEVVPARQFTVQEVDMLADSAGLRICTDGLYGDMVQGVGLSHEDAFRLVVVMKKTAEAV